MKRGDTFTHAYWLDAQHQPLVCEVTKVAQGVVYWKAVGDKKARHYFNLNESAKYCKTN